MKKKSKITVLDAIRMAFNTQRETFNAVKLCNDVKQITERPFLMDGTILRRLRELREDNPEKFNYRVINSEQAVYQKRGEYCQIQMF